MKSVCVIGLGYIGLPTASVLATNGFQVLGVDVDPTVVETVNNGDIHIEEPGLHTVVRAAIQSGNLRAAEKPEPCDAYILAVPTPLTADKKPEMGHVRATAEEIVPCLRPGALVILESTSPRGPAGSAGAHPGAIGPEGGDGYSPGPLPGTGVAGAHPAGTHQQ